MTGLSVGDTVYYFQDQNDYEGFCVSTIERCTILPPLQRQDRGRHRLSNGRAEWEHKLYPSYASAKAVRDQEVEQEIGTITDALKEAQDKEQEYVL